MKFQKNTASRLNRNFVFHPILIGSYFSITYLASNFLQLNPVEALRTIIFSILISGVVFGSGILLIKNKHKAGIIASAALFLFFTYGHVYNFFEDRFFLGHHRYLIPLWIGIFLLISWITLRSRKKLIRVSDFLNYFSVLLLILPGISIIGHLVTPMKSGELEAPRTGAYWQSFKQNPDSLPDVYYIILDTYPRGDVLLRENKFDNTDFYDDLRDRGFYIAECGLSNYNQTVTSLASSLNMDFLENFSAELMTKDSDFYKLGATINNSETRRLFELLGYQFITFETGYWWLDITNADLFISQYPSSWYKITHHWYLSYYEKDYLNTTGYVALNELLSSLSAGSGKKGLAAERAHYEMMNHNFDRLEDLAETEGTKFVYAHMIVPHIPYVFARDGSFHFEKGDDPGFTNQLAYVNQRILQIIDTLIKDSATPPVIVIQGDHGLDYEDRNAILNAYYFPGTENEMFYPTITPVNTFRLIFNTYFDANYPLLPDLAWYSTYQTPFDFVPYVDSCVTKPR